MGVAAVCAALAVGCTSFEPAVDGGDPTPTGTVVILPMSIDFGIVLVDAESAPGEFQLVGTGDTAPLEVAVVGDGFEIVNDECSGLEMVEGQVCTVGVRFRPTTDGALSASLEVLGKSAPVSGEGLERGVLDVSPANADFGEVEFGSSSDPLVLTITNSGASDVADVSVALEDEAQYAVSATTCTDNGGVLAPNVGCDVTLVYSPTDEGAHLTTLLVQGDSITQAAVSVGGIGTAPIYTLTATVIDISSPGFIESSPAGIDCEPTCTADYTSGTVVTLTAIGNDFTNWTGNCTGANPVCVLTMDGPKTARARFFDGFPDK